MTLSFIDYEQVDPDEIEELVGDNTIGMFYAENDEHIRGSVSFDTRRLRRALLAFEAEFDDNIAEIGIAIRNHDDGDFPVLVMTAHEGSYRAIAISPRGRTGDTGGKKYDTGATQAIDEVHGDGS